MYRGGENEKREREWICLRELPGDRRVKEYVRE
jgi:hypothetical protein